MGLSLANVFLCHYEIKWFNDCPEKFKPVFCKSYGDGFFILLKRPKHAKPFVDYINSKHKSINFSFEMKKNMSKYLSLMSAFSVKMVSF